MSVISPVFNRCDRCPGRRLNPPVAFVCRTAVHCSLFALYGLGGFLVQRKLLPIRVLLSAIGFTFSLVFATQGVVQTLADTRKVTSSIQRCSHPPACFGSASEKTTGSPCFP